MLSDLLRIPFKNAFRTHKHAASRAGTKSPQAVCFEIFVLLFALPTFLIIAHDANLKQIKVLSTN